MKIFEFLSRCRHLFNNQIKTSSQLDPVTFIIGNQSADLDSIISSICLAYYKFIKSNEISYLPVLNTTVDIIEGKDECKYFFNYHKISTKDFIFLNELANKSNNEIKFSNAKIFLVDHNKLDDLEVALKFENHVVGVIDHHQDENEFLNACKNEIRLIDNTIASNSLLISELIMNHECPELKDADSSLFSALLFAVLADTNCMSLTRSRITSRDSVIFDYLVRKSGLNLDDVTKLYSQIDDLRVNNSKNKSIEEILKSDYKQWTINKFNKTIKYGISSAIIEPRVWIEKENKTKWLNEVLNFKMKNNLSCLFILAVFTDHNNKLCRELLVFGDKYLSENFLKKMITQNEITDYETFQSDEDLCCLWMKPNDPKHTRKIWQPLIDSFLTEKLEPSTY